MSKSGWQRPLAVFAVLLAFAAFRPLPARAEEPVEGAISILPDASNENDEFILAKDLTRGESGYGLTVLEGDSIIRFPVTFIGSLENALVSQDIVLIHLEGDTFQKTGIIQGMSGSPIYFRGRLLGALAYGWQFSKEPIAGVTPIGLMLELIKQQSSIGMGSSEDTARGAPPDDPVHESSGVPPGFTAMSAPLSVAGLSPQHTGEAWRRIDELGFFSASGGRILKTSPALEPGSAVGVRLIDGDLSMTAIGTVTYVKDSDVLAFGHPFLNRGLSRLPMTGAHIETIFPATSISFKLGSSTDDMGTILRDGGTGISGTLGSAPSMIPMHVGIRAPWLGGDRDFNFKICRDVALSSRLMDIAWAGAVQSGLFTSGPAGVEVSITVSVEGRTATLRERGVVDNSILDMMPTLPIKMLYDNPFRRIHPDSVSISVAVNDDRRINEIVDIFPLKNVVRPGESLPIDIVFRTYDVGRHVERFNVDIPDGFPEGKLTVSVSGGRGLMRNDLPQIRDLNGLMDRLDAYESKDMLVISIYPEGNRKFEIEGGLLPGLPPGIRKLQVGSDRAPMGLTTTMKMDAPVFGKDAVVVEIRRD